jgi:hypothetical protein
MRHTFALSLLMLFSVPALCDEPAAVVHFLSHAEARAVLTTGAELLAAIITGSGIEHPEHPLWNKTRAWADHALR